jgi:hypothetical protein
MMASFSYIIFFLLLIFLFFIMRTIGSRGSSRFSVSGKTSSFFGEEELGFINSAELLEEEYITCISDDTYISNDYSGDNGFFIVEKSHS